jgi:hypothetical protein
MNSEERTKAIKYASSYASYGKWSGAKQAALELICYFPQHEYRENAKQKLLEMALYEAERLRELADALCWYKREKLRSKCPRGGYLIAAYLRCKSFPPTFSELKREFIAAFGGKKWNGGNEDDPSRGDYSARKTLKTLRPVQFIGPAAVKTLQAT